MVLEKTSESPLDCKEIKPVNPQGNEYSLGRLMVKLKLPILCPPDAENRLLGKDPDAGKADAGEGDDKRMRWLDGITASMNVS